MTEQQLPSWADPAVSPADLDPQGVSRRQLLRRAGLFGAAFALGSAATPAFASPRHAFGGEDPRLAYLVGDHHVHSVYSHDAKYTFSQQAQAAAQYGLDWMVFNEHSNFGHAHYGAKLEHAEILKARAQNPRQLIFQGLEWYIPAAEHCTVFAAPGPHETDLLTQFELAYDGKLLGYTDGSATGADTARNEAHAVQGIKWLAQQRRSGYVDDVLVLANHPLRLGIDSPHEMRNWRDAAPEIMIGMEGAGPARRVPRSPAGGVPPPSAASTRTSRPRSPGRATRRTRTSHTAASTGRPPRSAVCGTRCSPRTGCSRSPPTPTTTARSSTPGRTATGRPGRTSTTPASCPTR
jgi:hypothetical protein